MLETDLDPLIRGIIRGVRLLKEAALSETDPMKKADMIRAHREQTEAYRYIWDLLSKYPSQNSEYQQKAKFLVELLGEIVKEIEPYKHPAETGLDNI